MKIAVRGGHNFSVPGARGIIDETTEDRKVKDSVIKYLKLMGHSVIDVTPSDSSNTVNSDLTFGVNKANSANADLFISIHFNKAYTTYAGAIGTEVLVSNASKSNTSAKGVLKKLTDLGFKNRGIKERSGLYELRATNMSSMIVEVCFVEATEDVKLYRSLGFDAVGKAIAEGAVNSTVSTTPNPPSPSKPTPPPSKPNPTQSNPWVVELQKELNRSFNGNLTVDGLAGAKTSDACPTLSIGNKGKIVQLIQIKLNSLKFNCGVVDGVFGASTKTAIIAFQSNKGLTADGIMGDKTWSKLLNS
ncbi:MAG: N-acetylmuramoyl-L-alanine amidase [Clostridium sp.]|uniref:N-acetylmuramoyl-L-alanine amidase n=1 Tax=Clostridium sp. TaxID=1506 RepID=UPI003F3784DB